MDHQQLMRMIFTRKPTHTHTHTNSKTNRIIIIIDQNHRISEKKTKRKKILMKAKKYIEKTSNNKEYSCLLYIGIGARNPKKNINKLKNGDVW